MIDLIWLLKLNYVSSFSASFNLESQELSSSKVPTQQNGIFTRNDLAEAKSGMMVMDLQSAMMTEKMLSRSPIALKSNFYKLKGK